MTHATQPTTPSIAPKTKRRILLGAVQYIATSAAKVIHDHDLLGYREFTSATNAKRKAATSAYMTKLKENNTLGYMAKMELVNTAAAVAEGIEALRNYDPDADLKRAQARALADEACLKGNRPH
jgi:hypothetical protein